MLGKPALRFAWRSLQAALFLAALVTSAAAQQRATLRGQVTDVTGAYVANGTVRLFSEGGILVAKTRQRGEFEFDGISVGVYDLDATAPGFPITIIPDVQVNSRAPEPLTIMLRIGFAGTDCFERNRKIRYEAATGGRIILETRNFGSASPISGAHITVIGSSGKQYARGRTDDGGTIEFKKLPPGRYQIELSADGYTGTKVQNVWVTRKSLTRVRQDLMSHDLVILCQ